MKHSSHVIVALSLIAASMSVHAQGQRDYLITACVFTAEPTDATLQLPDLAERRDTVKDVRDSLFGPVSGTVRVDELAKEARVAVAVEVVGRNINQDDARLRDVHLRVAAAGQSFNVDGSGESWDEAARVATLKIRRWIAENVVEIDAPSRLIGPIR